MRLLEMHHLVHQGRQNLARATLLEVPDIERDLVVISLPSRDTNRSLLK